MSVTVDDTTVADNAANSGIVAIEPIPQIHVQYYYSMSDSEDVTIASCSVVPRHGTHYIVNLSVKGEHRRKGYARALLQKAIDDWGHEELWLHVASYTDRKFTDEELITFYGKFGFVPTDVPGALHRPADGY